LGRAMNYADMHLPEVSPEVEAWMEQKRAQPGFGKKRYSVRVRVGRADITLHKAAKTPPVR
jgi:hypothetical protein